MIATIDDIKHKEHMLAEKAQGILEHQQELRSLEHRKRDLKDRKPTTEQEQLSYEESIEFAKKVERYEAEFDRLEMQIQKLTRELTALEHQAKRLLPVSDVRVRVSTYTDGGSPNETFLIQHMENGNGQHKGHFKIEQV